MLVFRQWKCNTKLGGRIYFHAFHEGKQYARPFEADGRRLFKIGINFSKETRNIERWIVEEVRS